MEESMGVLTTEIQGCRRTQARQSLKRPNFLSRKKEVHSTAWGQELGSHPNCHSVAV